ncbi:MAG: FkbM family methyltransferase [Candidatus Paceibacterota bacterium]
MKDNVFAKFKQAEQAAEPWYSFSSKGIRPRLKRIFFLKQKYLIFTLYRWGFKKEARARLFFGRNITLPLGDANALKMYFLGTLGAPRERNLTAFLTRHLKSDDIFYDVGANFGFYTFLAEHLINTGEVHSFEPNERVFKYLKQNTTGSEILANRQALSDQVGTATFFDSVIDSSASSLLRQAKRPVDDYKKIEVETITLDEYVKTHTPPTIIKIDVEGAEYSVVKGGLETIKKYQPIIILEVWGGQRGINYHQPAVEFLHNLGCKSFKIEDDGSLSLVRVIDFNAIKRYENFVFKF